MRYLLTTSLTLLLCVAPAAGAPEEVRDDAAGLLAGVRRIALPGVPGTLTVFGPDAFSVVAAPCGGRPAPLVGATRYGRGRAVLFGHNYFAEALDVADTSTLVANVLRWAAGTAKAPRVGVLKYGGAVPRLERLGFTVVRLDGADWIRRLRDVDAAVLPLADLGVAEVEAVRRRLKAGLGVVGGMPGWGWQQLNPGRSLAQENPGNRLLAPAGLVWGGASVAKPADGTLPVAGAASAMTQASLALAALVEQADGRRRLQRSEAALAVATVTRAIREVPPDDELLLPGLARLLTRESGERFVPSHEAPLTDEQGLGKLLLALQIQQDALRPPGKITAHPAAAVFPGAVPPRAPRVRRALALDTAVPGWHSTGLYAPPGEVVTLQVPQAATDAGLELRLGAHKDRLWGKAGWRRAPEITRTFPVRTRRVEGACAFGGLVYVVVPPGCTLGSLHVQVDGAVEAPRFVLGRTSNAEWCERVRARPGPWAELETGKVILTVPAEHVRALDDPEALMHWWDRVLDGCADLAARPRERLRPERYVADEQISAGYMHAGYPIMTHLDAAPRFVDLATLSSKGDWGMFHEMGHNHQQGDWTFDGTGEVTCNLFSLYLMETVCAKGIGHTAMSPESIARHRALFERGGRAFGLWKSKPFTALIMYHQLRTAFGWEAYKKVFAEYRDLSDGQRPRTDAQKRDQWLVRMSRTVGRDLGAFFESWGVPVSADARAAAAGLPAWMPD